MSKYFNKMMDEKILTLIEDRDRLEELRSQILSNSGEGNRLEIIYDGAEKYVENISRKYEDKVKLLISESDVQEIIDNNSCLSWLLGEKLYQMGAVQPSQCLII